MWRLFRGCGHSFHVDCLLPDISVCKICKMNLAAKIDKLSKSCNDAVFAVDRDKVMDPHQMMHDRTKMSTRRTSKLPFLKMNNWNNLA